MLSASESVKPSPAGTVKPLMLTVVHFSAAETSLRELMVAVQGVVAARTWRASRLEAKTVKAENIAGNLISVIDLKRGFQAVGGWI